MINDSGSLLGDLFATNPMNNFNAFVNKDFFTICSKHQVFRVSDTAHAALDMTQMLAVKKHKILNSL
eukprot:snap_masked-scaffold_6-processed-gene-9.17-mRNA-1 protein AED:1.00 eAED:1.00 QI:0/-1/0/0/-1/1/1/0/66